MPQQPPQQPNIQNELYERYMSIPLITRFLISAVLGVSILGNFGIISPMNLFFHWPLVFKELQLWRILTAFFFTKFGFGLLMSLYFLYNYSNGLETQYFGGRPADYVFCLLFVQTLILFFAYIFETYFLLDSLVMSVVYLWSQANKDSIVQFMFGLRFKAMFLPLVLLAYETLLGSFQVSSVFAMLSGHIYWYLADVYPRLPSSNGRQLLKTPQVLQNYFPPSETSQGGFNASGSTTTTSNTRAQPQPQQRLWGNGQRLGTD